MGQQLIEVVRANITADGVEENLPFRCCYAKHETLGFGGIRILTKTSVGEKLESVAPNDEQSSDIELVFRQELRFEILAC